MRNLLFAAAGIAVLGYAATKVPWSKVRQTLADAEGEFGGALKGTIDRWAGPVREVAKTVLEEPMISGERKSGRSTPTLHS